MNYLAPITLIAALLTSMIFFIPTSASAALALGNQPEIIKEHSKGAPAMDAILPDDYPEDLLFGDALELQVLTEETLTPLQFITLQHINFNHDSYTLSPEAAVILDSAAKYYLENDTTINRILIDGHTSDIADDDYNYQLSDRRAYAVWDYLASQGIDIDRMVVTGKGEMSPTDENWTRSGRDRNRRVEVKIIKRSKKH